jgi:Tol biopolymer transport system component
MGQKNRSLNVLLVVLAAGVLLSSAVVVYLVVNRLSPPEERSEIESTSGQRIVYVTDESDEDETTAIYVMDADGSNRHRLAGSAQGQCTHPIWSPDGTLIAYIDANPGENGSWDDDDDRMDVWVVSADGSEATRVSDAVSEALDSRWTQVNWSPDGTRVAFAAGVYGEIEGRVYVVYADGSEVEHSLTLPFNVYHAFWAPTGDALLLIHENQGTGIGASILALADQQVTELSQNLQGASWSSDGTEIVIAADLAEQIIVVGRDGSSHWAADVPGFPVAVEWSPDGEHIAVATSDSYGRQDNLSLHIITLETGGMVTAASDQTGGIYFVHWSPDSRRIIYTTTFERQQDDGLPGADLMSYDVGSGELVQLTGSTAHNGIGHWSP